MKQTNFVVEICLTANSPLIIIRDPRGMIVKVASEATEVTSFLEDVINKMENSSPSN